MDNTIWAAIIGVFGSIVAGFIGGWIGATATRNASVRVFDQNLLLKEKAQKETIRGVLLGIKTEISALMKTYENEFLEAINAMEENDYFAYHYPLYQTYFTIYEANALHIGQIQDDDLRELIILTYIKAKGLIDTHLHNNEMLSKLDNLNTLSWQVGHPLSIAGKEVRDELVAYAPNFKINYTETKAMATQLIEEIDDFLPKLLESNLSEKTNKLLN